MARGRGGYRAPANPAPTSGPGSLSQRTDGGPGQPIRVAPGGDYGDRQALVGQQQAAPLASAGGGSPAAAGPGGGGLPPQGIFGPTTRPGEPVTSGVDAGPGPGAPMTPTFDSDVDYMIRAIAVSNPHLADYLLGLVED